MIALAPPVDDPRSEPITVARSALSSVAENGYAACANAADAVERAITALIADQPIALHQLKRAGYELQELAPNLARLSMIAESASA